MKAIETTMTVLSDGSIEMPPRPDLTPGRHRVVLVIEEEKAQIAHEEKVFQLKMLDIGAWPADFTARREDIYGDR